MVMRRSDKVRRFSIDNVCVDCGRVKLRCEEHPHSTPYLSDNLKAMLYFMDKMKGKRSNKVTIILGVKLRCFNNFYHNFPLSLLDIRRRCKNGIN